MELSMRIERLPISQQAIVRSVVDEMERQEAITERVNAMLATKSRGQVQDEQQSIRTEASKIVKQVQGRTRKPRTVTKVVTEKRIA